ncbi:MAG: MaoC family dehydratase [Rhizomicrobium sp.]
MSADIIGTVQALKPGEDLGASPWLTVTQAMIDQFGAATLDPDPMHIDPDWATKNGSFGGTIAFGFQTISLLTYFLHKVLETQPGRDPAVHGHYLNYGFDKVRLVSPVKVGARIRGHFRVGERRQDDHGRWINTMESTIEIENADRPALVGQWLSVWVPPDAS